MIEGTRNLKKALIILEESSIMGVGPILSQLIMLASESSATTPAMRATIDVMHQSLVEIAVGEQKVQTLIEKISQLRIQIDENKKKGVSVTATEKELNGALANIKRIERGLMMTKRNIVEEITQQLPTLIDTLKLEGIDVVFYDAKEATELKGCAPATLLEDIRKLDKETDYKCIVIGGGHGSTEVLSGLSGKYALGIADILKKEMKISSNLVCLGSCESAAFINRFRKLLTNNNGLVVGCVGDSTHSFIIPALEYATGKTDQFFDLSEYQKEDEANQKAAALGLVYHDTATVFDLGPQAAIGENITHWENSFVALASEDSEEYPLTQIKVLGSGKLIDNLLQNKSNQRGKDVIDKLALIKEKVKLMPFSESTQARLTAVNAAIAHVLLPGGQVANEGVKTDPIDAEMAALSIKNPKELSKYMPPRKPPKAKV